MKTYVLSLVFLSLLSGGMLWLMKNSRYEKHLRYLFSLVLLICLILPLKNILSGAFSPLLDGLNAEVQEYESGYAPRLLSAAEQALREEISAEIKRKTGLDENDFALYVTLAEKEKEVSFSKIECRLFSISAVTERKEIEKILLPYTGNVFFTEDLK